MSDQSPEFAHTRIEFGVIVDRTSKGLGYWLAETFGDYDRAYNMAHRSDDLFGFPATVKARKVTTTEWRPWLSTPPATGSCADGLRSDEASTPPASGGDDR